MPTRGDKLIAFAFACFFVAQLVFLLVVLAEALTA